MKTKQSNQPSVARWVDSVKINPSRRGISSDQPAPLLLHLDVVAREDARSRANLASPGINVSKLENPIAYTRHIPPVVVALGPLQDRNDVALLEA